MKPLPAVHVPLEERNAFVTEAVDHGVKPAWAIGSQSRAPTDSSLYFICHSGRIYHMAHHQAGFGVPTTLCNSRRHFWAYAKAHGFLHE